MSGILTTIRWLSIGLGALSLFYLGDAWFEFGLGDVFTRFYAWYAGILHPVVELLKPVALWIIGLLGWSLPVWWKDAIVLYLAMGGATGRGGSLRIWGGWEKQPPETRLENAPPGFRDELARRERWELWTTPVRAVFWPVFWIIDFTPWGWGSYMFWAVIEFFKILIGALFLAGLNAGLS